LREPIVLPITMFVFLRQSILFLEKQIKPQTEGLKTLGAIWQYSIQMWANDSLEQTCIEAQLGIITVRELMGFIGGFNLCKTVLPEYYPEHIGEYKTLKERAKGPISPNTEAFFSALLTNNKVNQNLLNAPLTKAFPLQFVFSLNRTTVGLIKSITWMGKRPKGVNISGKVISLRAVTHRKLLQDLGAEGGSIMHLCFCDMSVINKSTCRIDDNASTVMDFKYGSITFPKSSIVTNLANGMEIVPENQQMKKEALVSLSTCSGWKLAKGSEAPVLTAKELNPTSENDKITVIVSYNSKEISLDITPKQKISEIKAKTASLLETKGADLVFGSTIMKDDYCVADYNLSSNATLYWRDSNLQESNPSLPQLEYSPPKKKSKKENTDGQKIILERHADSEVLQVSKALLALTYEQPVSVPQYGTVKEAQKLTSTIIEVNLPEGLSINQSSKPIIQINEPPEYFCPESCIPCYFDEKTNMWVDYDSSQRFSAAENGRSVSATISHFTPVAARWSRLQEKWGLQPQFLDPSFDYDFTKIDDTGKQFFRGTKEYKRPVGWTRYAINVSGKFPDDTEWFKTTNDPAVWPVAYHGTRSQNVMPILRLGLQVGGTNGVAMGNGRAHGDGIYVTPSVEHAALYSPTAPVMTDEGSFKVKIVFQARVDPTQISEHTAKVWTLPAPDNIRLYGVLVKNV